MASDFFGRPNRDILEQSGLRRDADNDHHPDQQSERIEIDMMHRRLLADDTDSDHQ
ncbi:hypothetical protein D3C86_2199120 [compost metagenome]